MDSLQTRDAVLLGGRRWQLHRLDRLGVDHLPFTLKVLLENLLRHEDGQLVTAGQVEAVRRWDPAAGRDALAGLGGDPRAVNPVIPAELVTDHSVIADVFGRPDARERNVELEYERLGVLGWGIGGIEAEAVMLGQSLSLVVPPVVGFRLTGELPPGATATDLVLTITELPRGHGVVGKFVEFHGPGVSRTSVADRVTIANMSPELGSTCAVFPIDDQTLRYLRFTGRDPEHVALVEAVVASLAGPRRPQDRVPLSAAQAAFRAELRGPADPAARPASWVDEASQESFPASDAPAIEPELGAPPAPTPPTPQAMVAAGLLARNAGRRGRPRPRPDGGVGGVGAVRQPQLRGPHPPPGRPLTPRPGAPSPGTRPPPTYAARPTWTACRPSHRRSPTSPGRGSWSSWATPSPPTTSPRPGDPP